jgi:hypothetical protein
MPTDSGAFSSEVSKWQRAFTLGTPAHFGSHTRHFDVAHMAKPTTMTAPNGCGFSHWSELFWGLRFEFIAIYCYLYKLEINFGRLHAAHLA